MPDLFQWMKLEPVGELRPRDGLKKALEMSYPPPDEQSDFQALLERCPTARSQAE